MAVELISKILSSGGQQLSAAASAILNQYREKKQALASPSQARPWPLALVNFAMRSAQKRSFSEEAIPKNSAGR